MSDPVIAYPFDPDEIPVPCNTLNGAALPTLNATIEDGEELINNELVSMD